MTDQKARPKVDYATLYAPFVEKICVRDPYGIPTVVKVRPIVWSGSMRTSPFSAWRGSLGLADNVDTAGMTVPRSRPRAIPTRRRGLEIL